MSVAKIADLIITEDNLQAKSKNPKFSSYLTKLGLRIMDCPSLLAYFEDSKANEIGDELSVELVFRKIPDEYLQSLRDIIDYSDIQIFKFEKDSKDFTGIRFRIPASDIE